MIDSPTLFLYNVLLSEMFQKKVWGSPKVYAHIVAKRFDWNIIDGKTLSSELKEACAPVNESDQIVIEFKIQREKER